MVIGATGEDDEVVTNLDLHFNKKLPLSPLGTSTAGVTTECVLSRGDMRGQDNSVFDQSNSGQGTTGPDEFNFYNAKQRLMSSTTESMSMGGTPDSPKLHTWRDSLF
jgi:hypothetical protein